MSQRMSSRGTSPYLPEERPPMFELPKPLDDLLQLVKIDLQSARQRVSLARAALATVIAVLGTLAADALIVFVGTHIFPSTVGYPHFQFSDYARLTILGVLFACVGWPIVAYVSPQPRWLYLRLAILGTLVLYLPDLYILIRGQSLKAVMVLMTMHLAVILVTYNVMVHLAPDWRAPSTSQTAEVAGSQADRRVGFGR